MQIVIGIPAYNEEKNIAKILLKLQTITSKIIVCNDGSSDMTGEIAEKIGAIVINHPKNLGYGAGIRSIFLKAKELNPDILVTFDADGQHRIEDIQKVIDPIIKGDADIVIGSRFLSKNENVPTYRKLGINAITKIANITTKQKITDSQSGFRAYNKKAIQEINPSDYGMGVSTEILIKADKKELKITEVPIIVLYQYKNHLMAQILKDPKLVQHHGVAQMNIGGRGINPKFNPKRTPFAQFFLEFIFGHNGCGSAGNSINLVLNGNHGFMR